MQPVPQQQHDRPNLRCPQAVRHRVYQQPSRGHKQYKFDHQRNGDCLFVTVLREDMCQPGVLCAGRQHNLASAQRARYGETCAGQRQQRGLLINLRKARRLGQQKRHQPHRPECADVRVFQDGEPLLAVAVGAERVAGVAQAVQMDAARDKQRDERRAHRVKQRRRAEMRAEQIPQPLCRAHQRAHERQEGQRPAHGPFLPLHLRHGHCRVERKRDQQAAPRAFHGVSSSFTGSKMPHTDS